VVALRAELVSRIDASLPLEPTITWQSTFFGDFITNNASRRLFVKDIGEQHVVEDWSFIPSVNECLASLKLEPWMAGPCSRATAPNKPTEAESQSS
jgi:hypothetical protein